LLFFGCAVFGPLAAILWLVFAAFGVGDVFQAAFWPISFERFGFVVSAVWSLRARRLGVGSRNSIQCCPTRRCTRPLPAAGELNRWAATLAFLWLRGF
jgi:hypothetical protein